MSTPAPEAPLRPVLSGAPLRLVLASHNAAKLRELAALLHGLPLVLQAQPALGIAEAAEPYATFLENALCKACHAAAAVQGPAIADDSGLCVDALGGAPGVASAHFAPLRLPDESSDASPGPTGDPVAQREALRRTQDAANNALLLSRMQGQTHRRAAFVCTLVAVRHAHDPEPLVATGRWQGQLLSQAIGAGGFGYDPLVFIPALGASVANLDAETKNRHSHRALAAAQMRALMREAWRLGVVDGG